MGHVAHGCPVVRLQGLARPRVSHTFQRFHWRSERQDPLRFAPFTDVENKDAVISRYLVYLPES